MEYRRRHERNGSGDLHRTGGEVRPDASGGAGPMILIEVGEHRRLLRLYYATYAENEHPTPDGARERMRALAACNSFYEGGGAWR